MALRPPYIHEGDRVKGSATESRWQNPIQVDIIRPNLVNVTLTEYFRAKLLSNGWRAKLGMTTELH